MFRSALAILLLLPLAARAHESWIEPVAWQVAPGNMILADLRVGQNMKGTGQRFLPGSYPRFEAVTADGVIAPQGTIGDAPAMKVQGGAPGLYVLAHVSRDFRLKYKDFELFRQFSGHKDLGPLPERHAARGLPETGFNEYYTRYDKALVAVGDGAGADRPLGLVTELTALANPYADDTTGGLSVLLTYEGAPRPDTQVEVFDRAPDQALHVFTLRTDARGVVLVPVRPGHDYLLSAVKMVELDPLAPGDPVWHSHWASLTFHVPGR